MRSVKRAELERVATLHALTFDAPRKKSGGLKLLLHDPLTPKGPFKKPEPFVKKKEPGHDRSDASGCDGTRGSGTVWWGEATDEPAREDARPIHHGNCATTAPINRTFKF